MGVSKGAARDCSLAAMEQYRDLSIRGVRCIAPHTTHAHLQRNWRNLNEACRLVSSIVPVLLSYFWYCATGCMMSPLGTQDLMYFFCHFLWLFNDFKMYQLGFNQKKAEPTGDMCVCEGETERVSSPMKDLSLRIGLHSHGGSQACPNPVGQVDRKGRWWSAGRSYLESPRPGKAFSGFNLIRPGPLSIICQTNNLTSLY